MKRIGVLGVGSHCRNDHLPALRYLKEQQGKECQLAAALGTGVLRDFIPIHPDCGEGGIARLDFETAVAEVELLPACGQWKEEYVFSGEGFLLNIRPQCEAEWHDSGGANDRITAPAGPAGRWTTGETLAFWRALNGAGPWSPTPAEVLGAMRLTHDIDKLRIECIPPVST